MSGAGDRESRLSLKIEPDPGYELWLDRFDGEEALGRPFLYQLELSSEEPKPDLTSVLGASVTVGIVTDRQGQTRRWFNGVVANATYLGLTEGAHHYRLALRPWIWLLSRTQDCRIFQNKSAWDIITEIFRDAGFSDFEDRRRSQSGDTVLDYCVQYRETSLDFVTRLMELWGLYYFVTHDDGKHTVVLADDPNSHEAIGELPFHFEQTELRRLESHVSRWNAELSLQPGAYTVRDYNFTTPSADLTGKSMQAGQHGHDDGEVYEYHAHHETASVAQKLAAIRMQDLSARRRIVSGDTNARDLHAGCTFDLTEFRDDAQNRAWLVTSAHYAFTLGERLSAAGEEQLDTYSCSFTAIPDDTPFRLDRRTPWPAMRGPQTAKVVGQSGEEITTDEYGRVKVQFYWDREGTNDEDSSCWIRVTQPWAGGGFGGVVIPRIGQEVIVDFLEGNPDRPIITGTVYNASQTVPYALPANKTRATFKTSSSPGGGGANELRFEDKAGEEEVFVNASKDMKTVVKNDSVTEVTQGNLDVQVVAGKSAHEAAQSITFTVGGNSITIDMTGITIKGTMVDVKASATMTLDGGGAMTVKAGAVAIN